MYKAVFIDIDGTLIKSDHSVSEATAEAIKKLKEKNIKVILVSARPLHGMLQIIRETGLANYPVASLNGSYIANNEKIIFDSFIDLSTVSEVHQHLQKYLSTPIYYQQNQWFSELQNSYTDKEQKITSVPLIIQPFKNTLEHWQKVNYGPNKILIIGEEIMIREIQNNLKPRFIDSLNISTSKPTYLEVMNIKASKVNALKFLMDHYHIMQEETIAIGDNFNDSEMITFAGLGIAMGNAPEEVKCLADYVTDTNNNDGVAKALAKFIEF